MDKEITKVIFKKWPDGDVIAVFPELPGTIQWLFCMCYEHVGQHGSANVELMRSLAPAKPEEYADLKEELESIGYNLKVYRRFTYDMGQVRYMRAV
jgi:hypothetical protein